MRRNRLGNQYLKNRSEFNKNVDKKQWNYCLSFLRKTKKHIYSIWSCNILGYLVHFSDQARKIKKIYFKKMSYSFSKKLF